jgi:hypothetical protein
MADYREENIAWLKDQLKTHAGTPVQYKRGTSGVEVMATVGKTVFQFDKGYGLRERFEARDYLIPTESMIISGSQIYPKAGDRIEETRGSQKFIYEVMAPNNEPPWRYADPYGIVMRVHTKQIGTEVIP